MRSLAGTYKRLIAVAVLSFLMVAGIGLTGLSLAAGPALQTKTLDRNLEPVIITGIQVSDLLGSPLEQLIVYTYTNGNWGQIPFQIDEVTASGNYTSTEDNLLDGNDEVVLLAQDLGDQAPVTTPISIVLPISSTWYELEVTDPTSPGKRGWAYLVRSTVLTPASSIDYVSYASSTISATQYTLDFATGYVGLDGLTLNGSGVDILDRTKLRVTVDVGFTITLNEEGLSSPTITLLKDGPVRVILQENVTTTILFGSADLDATYLAYPALIQGGIATTYTLSLGTITGTRTSVDFNSAASGATFYNAHAPSGVTVDASPDTVSSTLSTWAQLSHNTGRVIQVSDLASVGGTQTTYYCDDTSECGDLTPTGDGDSYGDAGVLVTGGANNTANVQTAFFVLPAGNENVGATYQTYIDNLLVVEAIPPSVADVGIAKRVEFTNGYITYTLGYTNYGPELASSVVITDQVSAGINNLSFSAGGPSLIQTLGVTYAWTVSDTLSAGQGGIITITGQYQLGQIYTNTAYITVAEKDGKLANNSATAVADTRNFIYLPVVLKR